MEKHTDNNETLGLISLFVNSALNDPDEVKIVLPDECGDTLWDDVLNQELNACCLKKAEQKSKKNHG